MSIYDSIRKQLVPITPEGYPFIGAFRVRQPDPVLALAAARLGRHGAHLMVHLFLPRPAAGHAGARRPGRWRPPTAAISKITTAVAAARTRPGRNAACCASRYS